MKMYGTYVIFLLSAVCYSNAAVVLFPVEDKPAEYVGQEGCYIKYLNKVIPYGEYYPEDSCTKYTCHDSNITQLFSCGVIQVDWRCELVSDESRNYPDCCPEVMCHTFPPEAFEVHGTSDTPVVEHLTTKDDEATTVNYEVTERSSGREARLNDETLNELLIAQASINKQ